MQDLYAIQQISTGQLLYYDTEERETEYYSKTFTYLTKEGYHIWTTQFLNEANAALNNLIPYYDKAASLNNEVYGLNELGDLKIVKLVFGYLGSNT